MKSLFQFLQEENATPGNTTGMGNPTADDGSGHGTEPLTAKAKIEKLKRKRKKKRKPCKFKKMSRLSDYEIRNGVASEKPLQKLNKITALLRGLRCRS